MDIFGGVPLVTTTEVEATARVSRDSMFEFIEAELNAARTVLPATRRADQVRARHARRGGRDPRESLPQRAASSRGTVNAAAGLHRKRRGAVARNAISRRRPR